MAVPTTDDVRAWVNVPKTSVTDAQLEQVIAAERQNQRDACTVPALDADYPEVLAQSLYRRVARHLAGRQVPLGVVGDGSEYGPASLATFDAEVERLEGPRRMVVFG
jgi:hypothetical protein